MANNIELLNKKIAGYLTGIQTRNKKITELEAEIGIAKKEISRQKSQYKKNRIDRNIRKLRNLRIRLLYKFILN